MNKRVSIAIGMATAMLWALGLVILAPSSSLSATTAVFLSWTGPGLALALLIGRLAQRRFFDDGIIDGQPFRGPDA